VVSDRPSFWISSERIFGKFSSWKYSGVKRALSSLKSSTVENISESRGKPVEAERREERREREKKR
jgi:hypothetical protein